MCQVLGYTGFSGVALQIGWLPTIGHEAHLGGYAMGFLHWISALRQVPVSKALGELGAYENGQ